MHDVDTLLLHKRFSGLNGVELNLTQITLNNNTREINFTLQEVKQLNECDRTLPYCDKAVCTVK